MDSNVFSKTIITTIKPPPFLKDHSMNPPPPLGPLKKPQAAVCVGLFGLTLKNPFTGELPIDLALEAVGPGVRIG